MMDGRIKVFSGEYCPNHHAASTTLSGSYNNFQVEETHLVIHITHQATDPLLYGLFQMLMYQSLIFLVVNLNQQRCLLHQDPCVLAAVGCL